jgi:hypothetical protein
MDQDQLRAFILGEIETRVRAAAGEPGTTINRADELPGGIKLAAVCPACGNGARLTPCPVCNPKKDRAKPISDAQTGVATNSTVPRSPVPDTEPRPSDEDSSRTPPSDRRETTSQVKASPTTSFEPEDFEAALRRQPAFEEAPPSAAQIAEENEPSAKPASSMPDPDPADAVPQMVDGDLGIKTACSRQKPVRHIPVTKTIYREMPAKGRWLAGLATVVRWSVAFVALAVVLLAVFYVGEAISAPPAPSAVTVQFNW